MITRGIVEKVITPYSVKVRMPSINDMSMTGRNLLAEDLNDATICTLSHVDPSLQVGDVVFVGFEDNNMGKPVVLGHLYRHDMGKTFIGVQSNSLKVNLHCELPEQTDIGNVTAEQLGYLSNVSGDIQLQINRLLTIISDLQKQITELKSDFSKSKGE